MYRITVGFQGHIDIEFQTADERNAWITAALAQLNELDPDRENTLFEAIDFQVHGAIEEGIDRVAEDAIREVAEVDGFNYSLDTNVVALDAR
jgi:hypothetical protein